MTGDCYDASRLLLLDTIRQFRVKGDYIAMVPNRDTLIVTGAEDADGLKAMVGLAKDAVQKPRHLWLSLASRRRRVGALDAGCCPPQLPGDS